ncbi:hypothetical protein NEIRO02_2037 [Nematocida sp. AWRm79]|nr:hypothetical protein NEIRO02_2037 [Nematocida sp. AWRm79]
MELRELYRIDKKKLYRIIIICTMYIAYILFIDQNISEVCFNVFCSTDKEIEIGFMPNGPLFQEALNISYKNQFMYNKIIWAKEVKKYLCRLEKGELEKPSEIYGIEKLTEIENITSNPSIIVEEVIAERNEIMINILKTKIQEADICKDQDRRKYLIEYAHQLLLLFPSKYGIFSTVSEKEDSLSNYLLVQVDSTYSSRIVAVLFILSQGVDLPIEIKKEEDGSRSINLFLYGEEAYIEQKIPIDKENEGNPEYITEIEQLINFLRDCMKNPIFSSDNPNGIKEPTTYEEFMTGDFLNTPQFLIQSYIHEIIDSQITHDYIKGEILTILLYIINSEFDPDLVEKSQQLYNKCFLKLNSITADQRKIHKATINKYWDDADELELNNDESQWIPFKHIDYRFTYTRVQKPNPNADESQIEVKEDAKYLNTVEFALLTLFCCIMYDPFQNKYTTEHLPKTFSSDVKEFFETHNDPNELITQEMQQEWSDILSNLNDSNIRYNKDKYELKSGLINILHVIKCIIGSEEEINDIITHVKGENTIHIPGVTTARVKMGNLLEKLSNNPEVYVCDYSFKMEKVSKNESDFFGWMSVLYEFDQWRNGLVFTISQTHMAVDIYPEEFIGSGSLENINQERELDIYKARASTIAERYKNPTSFIEYVILQRAKIEKIITNERQYARQYVHSDYVNEWLREDKNMPIDFIFLQGRIADMMD